MIIKFELFKTATTLTIKAYVAQDTNYLAYTITILYFLSSSVNKYIKKFFINKIHL